MRLTTKGRFAVTAMIDLALRQDGGPVTLAAISQRQQISLSYLEQLFGKLRRNELVESTRGPGGGYSLGGEKSDEVVAAIPGAKLRSVGPCLITHWGLSGPAILKLSAWGARELAEKDYLFEVVINWCGNSPLESVETRLLEAREVSPKKRVRSGLQTFSMPSRLWHRIAEDSGIAAEVTWSW